MTGCDRWYLFLGRTFTGQGGLADEEILRFYNAHVCRYHIARRKKDEIADGDILQGNFLLPFALADDRAGRRNQFQELSCRITTARFLDKAEGPRKDDQHGNNDDRSRIVVVHIVLHDRDDHIRHDRNGRQEDEDDRKGIDKGFRQTTAYGLFLFPCNPVFAVCFPALCCFCFAQAVLGRAQLPQQIRYGKRCFCLEGCLCSSRCSLCFLIHDFLFHFFFLSFFFPAFSIFHKDFILFS